MKAFNQTIKIEVEVDMVAKQLRSMFKDETYADTVVETIIGRAMVKDTSLIGRLMSAMVGVEKVFVVQVGTSYKINNLSAWGYWTEESIENKSTVDGNVHTATVIDINPHSDYPIQVEYYVPKIDGFHRSEKKWVSSADFGTEPEIIYDAVDNM